MALTARGLAMVRAMFLAAYGWRALGRAKSKHSLTASTAIQSLTLGAALSQAAAFTLLNPHRAAGWKHRCSATCPSARVFIAGASCASLLWFGTLGSGSRLLAPYFASPRAWQMLDRLIGVTMMLLSALLVPHAVATIHSRANVLQDPAYASTSLGSYTNFAPFLGVPAVSIPNGFRPDGLPTGAMMIGRRSDDIQMLQVADSVARQ